ncbi:MAG: adenosylmethionine--8-amino-7-oxononanoate transaminase [Gammaproteobacteria bacterium]
MNNNDADLLARDKKVIWHPYTQHGLEEDCLPVTAGQGAWLMLQDGQVILDAISSWWVNLHGHGHPAMAQAIYDQAHQLEHVMFAGFTHEPAVELAETLVNAVKARGTALSRCFYSDNGSTAVEAALKIAYQYHKNLGQSQRNRFISVSNAFHGDTLGSMALSSRAHYHRHFADLLPAVDFISADHIQTLEHYLAENAQQYAALIIEPLVQGAAGMAMHSVEFLTQVAALCKKHNVLLICDEVFTGFYRTGTCFAFEQAGIQPDLLCLSKGLTGGFLPLGATLVTEEIFSAFCSTQVEQAFLHGHSYTANPLACAAALTSWRLLHRPETQLAIQRISVQTEQWIAQLAQHHNGSQARALGTIGAINLQHIPDYFSDIKLKIRRFALSHHVLLRPIGPVLYAVPPYCVTESELNLIYSVMEAILNENFTA